MSFRQKIEDARKIAQKPKGVPSGDSWYCTYFVNYFSIYISYPLAKLGVSANFITVFMGVTGLCGSLCMVPHDFRWNLVGAALWQLWFIFDCVDGEVARLRKKTSLLGVYLDRLTHIIVNSTFVLAFGLHVYFQDLSILNLALAVIIYSAWHWKRDIPPMRDTVIGGKDHFSKSEPVIHRKISVSTIIHVMMSCFRDVEVMLLLSAIILSSHKFGLCFARFCLYGYTFAAVAYVGAMTLRHSRQIVQKDRSKLVEDN